jgi:hypothetical protein
VTTSPRVANVPVEEDEAERQRRPGLQALVWGMFAFCVAVTATSVFLSLRGRGELPDSLTGIGVLSGVVLELLFAIVGLLIVAHRPGNLVGWLLLVPSFIRNIEKLFVFYGAKALVVDPGTLPLGDEALWVNTWIWMPLLAVVPVLLLVYPEGKLLSLRWRWVAWTALAGGAVTGLAMAVAVWPHRGAGLLYPDNGLDELALVVAAFVTLLVVWLATTSLGLASLVIRYRRGSEEERLQIKWLAVAVVVLLVDAILLAAFGETEADWREVLSNLAFATVPIAIGIALFKYRLYGIDTIIDRSLVYVPLLAIITALTSALVPVSQKVFVTISGSESDATIVLTAVLLTVLVTPVKRGLESLVEGRFKPKPEELEPRALLDDPEFVGAVRTIADQAAADALSRSREPPRSEST